MKPPPFRYHAPRSKAEALQLLASLDNSRLLAGGQSLMPMLNFRLLAPDHLVDINRIDELRGTSVTGRSLYIGAMTRQSALEASGEVSAHAPLLQAALAHVGHRPTRNRGTLGGSLCHLDPAAELVTASAALEATLIAESSRGARRIPFADWCEGYLTNALRSDEMLTGVEYPLWPSGHGHAFSEYARRAGDFAIVGVAALVAFDAQGRIERAVLAVGGCAPAPQRLTEAERRLLGTRGDAASIDAAARAAANVEATSDPHVSADHRRHLARVLTGRALAQGVQRAMAGAAR
jgi:carbon-monoxide dehydrogenase medium subunit